MADTALLSGDARLLTLKIAAPGVTAMLASSACQLFEALVLAPVSYTHLTLPTNREV